MVHLAIDVWSIAAIAVPVHRGSESRVCGAVHAGTGFVEPHVTCVATDTYVCNMSLADSTWKCVLLGEPRARVELNVSTEQ